MCGVTHQPIYVVIFSLRWCSFGLFYCFWNMGYKMYDVLHSGWILYHANLNNWQRSACFCFTLVYVSDADIPTTRTRTSGWRTAPSVWRQSKAQWTWTEMMAQCWTFTLWVQTRDLRLCSQHFLHMLHFWVK